MPSADEIIDEGFKAALARIAELRMTPHEFREKHTDLGYMAYWRALNSKVKTPARTVVLRKIEEALDRVESKRAEKEKVA